MAGASGDLPLRPREMRDRNRALVLDAVARNEPVTRAQLAARTGLTKSSVSSIVQELLAAGLVVEQGAQRGRELGRPGTALTLARDGLAGLGLEVNVDYLAACVVDLARLLRLAQGRRKGRRGSGSHVEPRHIGQASGRARTIAPYPQSA